MIERRVELFMVGGEVGGVCWVVLVILMSMGRLSLSLNLEVGVVLRRNGLVKSIRNEVINMVSVLFFRWKGVFVEVLVWSVNFRL